MKKTLLIAAITLFPIALSAQHRVPAVPHPIEHIQPNGDTLVYRLHGDEHKHWQTTLDGYLIKQNRHGRMCYAKQRKDGTTKATCRTAHNAADRKKSEEKYIKKHIPNTNK